MRFIFQQGCSILDNTNEFGMGSSSISRRIYELLVKKSIMDDTDLEIIEDSYLGSEYTASLKPITFFSIAAALIAASCSAPYQVLGLSLCPALGIGLLEVTKWFLYHIVSSYVSASSDFDSVFHQVVAAIRSREVTFFGQRKKFDINASMCLRSLRCELLSALRCEVQSHVRMSRSFCRHNDDSEKLLCEMFSFEMSRLALESDICDDFLHLSSLKELWQLLFLLRSEYLRLFLLHLSKPSHKLILVFVDLLREMLLCRSRKTGLLSGLEFIDYRDSRVREKKIQKFSTPLSTVEKVLAYLSFASEVLNDKELPDEEKFLHAAGILTGAVELLTPETHTKHEGEIRNSIMSLSSSPSTSADEGEPMEVELPCEKIYEGSPVASDDEQHDVLFSSWEEEKSNDAARSVVMELKAHFVERNRGLDAATETNSDVTQKMLKDEDEFRKRSSEDQKCDEAEQLSANETANQNDTTTFTTMAKNKDTVRSRVGMDLKEALSLRKLAPSVCFTDDPENESSSSGTEN